jgi:pyrroline-5-carboxylate reductase
MKISIIGGGNMGGAIAKGLATGSIVAPQDITVINRRQKKADELKAFDDRINAVTNDYSSLKEADIVIVAVKPWMVEELLNEHRDKLNDDRQILASVAGNISLKQLASWSVLEKPIFRIMPNTAIEVKQSMTFIASANASEEDDKMIVDIFSELGKAVMIGENMFAGATSLASCGIAYAFRYIRAAMEGGVEIGLYPNQAKETVLQTLRGAIELLETNQSHPEEEIDKVTTAGGITIKGLNEMEHNGFTSAVIKGLKAST